MLPVNGGEPLRHNFSFEFIQHGFVLALGVPQNVVAQLLSLQGRSGKGNGIQVRGKGVMVER